MQRVCNTILMEICRNYYLGKGAKNYLAILDLIKHLEVTQENAFLIYWIIKRGACIPQSDLWDFITGSPWHTTTIAPRIMYFMVVVKLITIWPHSQPHIFKLPWLTNTITNLHSHSIMDIFLKNEPELSFGVNVNHFLITHPVAKKTQSFLEQWKEWWPHALSRISTSTKALVFFSQFLRKLQRLCLL